MADSTETNGQATPEIEDKRTGFSGFLEGLRSTPAEPEASPPPDEPTGEPATASPPPDDPGAAAQEAVAEAGEGATDEPVADGEPTEAEYAAWTDEERQKYWAKVQSERDQFKNLYEKNKDILDQAQQYERLLTFVQQPDVQRALTQIIGSQSGPSPVQPGAPSGQGGAGPSATSQGPGPPHRAASGETFQLPPLPDDAMVDEGVRQWATAANDAIGALQRQLQEQHEFIRAQREQQQQQAALRQAAHALEEQGARQAQDLIRHVQQDPAWVDQVLVDAWNARLKAGTGEKAPIPKTPPVPETRLRRLGGEKETPPRPAAAGTGQAEPPASPKTSGFLTRRVTTS